MGGADGGVYILIEEDENLNDSLYCGRVYYEDDKTIWYEGPFKLVGDIDFSINNRDQYLGWDGESILLKESSYLEALNPIPPL